MQEDDKEANDSQPQPQEQPPSDESAADESQPQPQEQPPPTTPTPPATPIRLPPTQRRMGWQYLLGLVLGLIPLIVFLVGYGLALRTTTLGDAYRTLTASGGPVPGTGLILYLVELVVTIAFLSYKKLRFAGYGLLTAFLVTPIVAAIGCSVLPNVIHA